MCVRYNCGSAESSQSTEIRIMNIPEVEMDGLEIFAAWQTANKDIKMNVLRL